MSKRDIFKTAEQAKISDRYDIELGQIQALMSSAEPYSNSKIFDAIVTAFKYGYVMGTRAEKVKHSK